MPRFLHQRRHQPRHQRYHHPRPCQPRPLHTRHRQCHRPYSATNGNTGTNSVSSTANHDSRASRAPTPKSEETEDGFNVAIPLAVGLLLLIFATAAYARWRYLSRPKD